MKFILIALITNTTLGTFPNEKQCLSTVRAVYERKVDPMLLMDTKVKQQLVDIHMKWTAPKEYMCRKIT